MGEASSYHILITQLSWHNIATQDNMVRRGTLTTLQHRCIKLHSIDMLLQDQKRMEHSTDILQYYDNVLIQTHIRLRFKGREINPIHVVLQYICTSRNPALALRCNIGFKEQAIRITLQYKHISKCIHSTDIVLQYNSTAQEQ